MQSLWQLSFHFKPYQAKQRANIRSILSALIHFQLWITSHISKTRQEMLPLRLKIWLLNLQKKGISVLFIWVPAHCGITGNELADQAAKQASQLGLITQTPITGPEFLSSISSNIFEEEEAWLHSSHTQLLDLYDYKQPSKEMYLTSCILSTCLFRLRCGNAKTKSTLFQWKMAPSPNCEHMWSVGRHTSHYL